MIPKGFPHCTSLVSYMAGGWRGANGLMMLGGPHCGSCVTTLANEPEAHRPGPTVRLALVAGVGSGRANTLDPTQRTNVHANEVAWAGVQQAPTRSYDPVTVKFVRALRAYGRTPLLEVRANGRSLLRGEHPSGVLRFGFAGEVRPQERANELTADSEFARKLLGAVCLCIRHVCDFSVRANGRKSPIRVVRLRTDLRIVQITRMAGLEFVRVGATNVMANAIPRRAVCERTHSGSAVHSCAGDPARSVHRLGAAKPDARVRFMRSSVRNVRTTVAGSFAWVTFERSPTIVRVNVRERTGANVRMARPFVRSFCHVAPRHPPLLPPRGRSAHAKRGSSERAKRRPLNEPTKR